MNPGIESTKSILMVAEEIPLLHTLSLLLLRAGYLVTSVNGLSQAYSILHLKIHDLLFIDLSSIAYDLSGLITGIRLRHPQIAILMLSSCDNFQPIEMNVVLLMKPVDPVLVLEAVEKQIGPAFFLNT